MSATTLDPSLSVQIGKNTQRQTLVVEEIEGIIRVHKNGYVERPPIVPSVTCALPPELGVSSNDVVIDKFSSIWARFYVPKSHGKLPLLVYFHGGGFCIGSAAWSCYHDFLARLSVGANCMIMSVNYGLAPENRLPAAYDDGFEALMWVKQHAFSGVDQWWSSKCDFSSIFLAGDSAGANIAHNVAIKLSTRQSMDLKPLIHKGTILIQPFFGGEKRTHSEKYTTQPPFSALSLAASDAYWRLSLPSGANRDHPWCNPLAKGSQNSWELKFLPETMVFIAEMDLLKDRNLEFCAALANANKKVEYVIYGGVGHAFQILNKSQLSETRTLGMISHIKGFLSR